MLLIAWLNVYLFVSCMRIFHSYRDVIIAGIRPKTIRNIKTRIFSMDGTSACWIWYDSGQLIYAVSFEGLAFSIRFLRKPKGTEDMFCLGQVSHKALFKASYARDLHLVIRCCNLIGSWILNNGDATRFVRIFTEFFRDKVFMRDWTNLLN